MWRALTRAPTRWALLAPLVISGFVGCVKNLEPGLIERAEEYAFTNDPRSLEVAGWSSSSVLFPPLLGCIIAGILAPRRKRLTVVATVVVLVIFAEPIGGALLGTPYGSYDFSWSIGATKVLALGAGLLVAEIFRKTEEDKASL